MFGQTNDASESNLGELVDRDFAIIKLLVRHTLQENFDQVRDLLRLNAHGNWGDLLIIANDNRLLAEVEGKEGCRIALAGFVHDHHVEARDARVERFRNFSKRHDPHRDCIFCDRHLATCGCSQLRVAHAFSGLRDLTPHR